MVDAWGHLCLALVKLCWEQFSGRSRREEPVAERGGTGQWTRPTGGICPIDVTDGSASGGRAQRGWTEQMGGVAGCCWWSALVERKSDDATLLLATRSDARGKRQ